MPRDALSDIEHDWLPTRTGGWIKFLHDDTSVVLFQKEGQWGVAHNDGFSKARYDTDREAAHAFEANAVSWNYPYRWKPTKAGGQYRHDPHFGVISVKRAANGKWYWVTTNSAPQGWFDTMEAARVNADTRAREATPHVRLDLT